MEVQRQWILQGGYVVQLLTEPDDVSGMGDLDPEQCLEVEREFFGHGNDAAWFCAQVTVSYHEVIFGESTRLHFCSYASFDSFIEDPYFGDMVREAFKSLRDSFEAVQAVKLTPRRTVEYKSFSRAYKDLDEALGDVQMVEATTDEEFGNGMDARIYTVSTGDDGVVGVFFDEKTAARFRLSEVNRLLNP